MGFRQKSFRTFLMTAAVILAVAIGMAAHEFNDIVGSQPRAVDRPARQAIRKELIENGLQREVRHEGSATLKSWSQGKVQDFHIRQIKALLPDLSISKISMG